jgi:hypothetical protein
MSNRKVLQFMGSVIIICLLSTLMAPQLQSQSVTLAISDTSAASSSLLKLPIRTTNVTGLGIISMSIKLSFDPNVLDALGANSKGTISQSWGNPLTMDSTGQIQLAMAGLNPLDGEGILTYVFFEVIGAKGYTTTIHFKSANINEGNIVANTISAKFTVLEAEPSPNIRLAMPDTSGEAGSIIDLPIRVSDLTGFHIDSLRLTLTFNKYVLQAQKVITTGTLTESWKDTIETLLPGSIALFLKGSQALTDSGKLCLLRFQLKGSSGMATPIHFQSVSFYNEILKIAARDGKATISGGTTTEVMVSIPDISADSASTITVPVFISTVNQLDEVRAITINLAFNCNVIQYQSYNVVNTLMDGWFSSANPLSPSQLKFGGSSAYPMIGRGVLVEFAFKVVGRPGMQTAITFSELTLNEGSPSVTAFGSVFTVNYVIPVELISFSARLIGKEILLSWETASESDNYGFEVERSTKSCTWQVIGFVPGQGSTTTPQHYVFQDKKIGVGTYNYRLKQIDYDGSFVYSTIVQAIVAPPQQFSLGQNFPNPFNLTTFIPFDLPEKLSIKFTLYNVLGEIVDVIATGDYSAGHHQVSFNTRNLGAGLYFYKLEAKDFVAVKKLLILK